MPSRGQTRGSRRIRGARRAGVAFGIPDVFLEKFVVRAKHIEVQLLGDKHGGLVHLFERDCSIQRRHQKVVELAPAPNLPGDVRQGILDAALAVGRACGIDNASTVEFLYDTEAKRFSFIEVNPRIQVEHTVTEQVTGFDIVRSQILIASGLPLNHPRIGLEQSAISTRGYAIQCRVTTEDPANGFVPDYGRLSAYRSSGGPGIRLDAGTAFGGAVITPFYDSLLGESDGQRIDVRRVRGAHGTVPSRVPRARGEDEHSVPVEPDRAPAVPGR